jgi:hypothetical protein
MLGLSDLVTNMTQNLRVAELDLSKQFRRLLAIQTFIGVYLIHKLFPFRDFKRSSKILLLTASFDQQ